MPGRRRLFFSLIKTGNTDAGAAQVRPVSQADAEAVPSVGNLSSRKLLDASECFT